MVSTFSVKYIRRIAYFLSCCILIVCLSTIRTKSVYGKLDFILVDSRPWWPEWKPMVLSLMNQGDQPVYTDPTTSTVFKAVFDQETVLFRIINYVPRMKIEEMDRINQPLGKLIPYGSLLLLLQPDIHSSDNSRDLLVGKFTENGLVDMWISVMKDYENFRRYRCVINLQGFKPSWVSWETKHWNPLLSHAGMLYSYNSEIGSSMVSELRKNPPENCEVFY